MDKILPKRTMEELGFLKSKLRTIEDVGYANAISGYSCDEETVVKFLNERGYCFGDVIFHFRRYLLGYMIGDLVLANSNDKNILSLDMGNLPLSPIGENKLAKELLEEMLLKEKNHLESIDDVLDDIYYFYSFGRLDASILEKNNSKYIATIINGALPYNKAFKLLLEYLKGFYYETQIQLYKKEHPDFKEDDILSTVPEIEEVSPLCFYGEAEYILQRCMQ